MQQTEFCQHEHANEDQAFANQRFGGSEEINCNLRLLSREASAYEIVTKVTAEKNPLFALYQDFQHNLFVCFQQFQQELQSLVGWWTEMRNIPHPSEERSDRPVR
jgi:hypothetical protein